ncbi:MAG TPA: PD-(D/E)XK nuclease family protein, partial [Steroidobacteraceae bacterium]|nr:PD-(D/E)XK nuclease family protein [Steroidobacteraceae bacterium]
SEAARAIELLDRCSLDEKHLRRVSPMLCGYLNAYKKFKAECRFIPTQIEKKIENKQYGYQGRLDRVGLFHGKECLADFKTGIVAPATRLQLALYGYALDPKRWWPRLGVQLKPDGSYQCVPYDVREWPSDLATALACVRVALWKAKHHLI